MTNHLSDEQLIGYIHHTLTDAEREAINQHLADCPTCRTLLDENEVFQRRVRNDLSTNLRQSRPSSQMSFSTIAPHIKRKRRLMMFANKSNQLLSSAVAIIVLIVVGIGLFYLINNRSQPEITAPEPAITAPEAHVAAKTEASAIPIPTDTLVPTDTPVPTVSPTPTNTPIPTNTPTDVPTLIPTSVPTLTPTPSPVPYNLSAEDLYGAWELQNDTTPLVIQFNEDGTYEMFHSKILFELDLVAVEGGQFQVEGTSLTLVTPEGYEGCGKTTGTYEVELTEEDQFQLTMHEEQCSLRKADFASAPWSRILP